MVGRIGFAALLAVWLVACDEEDPRTDGGTGCTEAAECDDSVFCNGVETCESNDEGVGRCAAGTPPCEDLCDEVDDACIGSLACVAPRRPCHTDADCGPQGDVCTATATCDPDSDDADANGCVITPPTACPHGCDPEVGCLPATPVVPVCQHDLECGGYCDGYVCDPGHANAGPDGCRSAGFVPRDFCAALTTNRVCCETAGSQTKGCFPTGTVCALPLFDRDSDGIPAVVAGGSDCDDYDPHAFPGNLESCDALGNDEDCDPSTVALGSQGDEDGDGIPSSRCWNVGPPSDATPNRTVYVDGIIRGADCDDGDSSVRPSVTDVCNGRDDDCDGVVDELVAVAVYADRDGDGFGDASCTYSGCGTEPGFVLNANDCADFNASLTPGTGPCIDATTIGLCMNGAVVPTACGAGQQCVPQADGTGDCR